MSMAVLNFDWVRKSLDGIEAAMEEVEKGGEGRGAEFVVLYGALAAIGQQITDIAKREEALIRDSLVRCMVESAQTRKKTKK